jgi:aqualysin 1
MLRGFGRTPFALGWLLLAAAILSAPASAGELLRQSGPKTPGQYIVVFKGSARAASVAPDLARTQGGELRQTWSSAINGALISGLTEEAAVALAKDPRVAWVQEDGFASIDAVQASPPWHLDRLDERDLPLSNSFTYGFDGSGIHAYVLDTGIRETHVEFGARASRDFDSVGDGMNGADCHGHGTHVAGLVGGSTYGVAKNVRIHAVRVCSCNGQCADSAVLDGIAWVMDNAVHPAVVNMSLGDPQGDVAIDAAVSNAINSGLFFSVSAGNSNGDACNGSPARLPIAFTVGATNDTDGRAWFSNFGSCVDLFAPGDDILSAWASSDTATFVDLGTSMAAPLAAGAAALLLDANPAMTVTQIANRLIASSTTGVVGNAGTGSPNRLLSTLGPPPPAPSSLTVLRGLCFGLNDATWTPSSGATSYQLFGSSTSNFSTQTLLYSGPDLSRSITVSGTRYLRVRACSADGCGLYRNGNQAATYTPSCH